MDINENTIMKKVKNIIIGWYRKIFNKKSELAEKRLAICSTCSYKTKLCGQDICDLCGCVLDAKVRVEDEQCYNNNGNKLNLKNVNDYGKKSFRKCTHARNGSSSYGSKY